MVTNFTKLAKKIGETLQKKKMKLATAESCTGGLVTQIITSIAGSSQWFERGFITYSNEAKHEMLGVPLEIIRKYGAVSKETAIAMAQGALQHSQAQISLSVTGIAGPRGGTEEKPVGTVWFAIADRDGNIETFCQHFPGNRQQTREQAAVYILERLF